MQYQDDIADDYEYVDDDQLKTFEEMMGEDDMGYDDGNYEQWEDGEIPVMSTRRCFAVASFLAPGEDVTRYLEEKGILKLPLLTR